MFRIIKSVQIVLIAVSLLLTSAVTAQTSKQSEYKGAAPKYIFFFIGDGMGLSQANTAEAYLGALNKTNGIQKLNLSSLPKQGFYTTYASDRFITGSAAAGTALSTGGKTTVNTIGMDAKRQKPLKTIAELAKEKGYKVGIVSSVSIDHATPAAFYAHQPTRNMYYNISLDLSKSGFNYFAGGGFKNPEGDGKHIEKNSMANFGMGESKELEDKEPNSMKIAEKRGYRFVNTVKDFKKLKKGDDKIISIAPNLSGGSALPYFIDQNGKTDISLAEFTKKGIEILDNKDGFFMMVEGGKIDWACHANDAATVIQEVLQFDNAVAEALKFYNKHPEETLILVAGDHETGGMALGFSGSHYSSDFAVLQHQKLSYEAFSDLIKEYKKTKEGNYKVEDGLALVKKHFGLGDTEKKLALSEFELKQLKAAFEKSMNYKKEMKKDDQFYLLYGSYDPLTITACHILSQKAGIGWTSFSHTAAPIPIRSIGVGSDLFVGFYDNTDVPKNLMKLIE
ncbi:alkaline phosphatase [Marinifilum sp. N1E240]|uniref:alkaline phosphatase n=1 Tax=Marinifilum sp. N1E240 TaxID=2608082 RepID=UPI00128E19A7|nr:alkaline phosphatase [Marinifilum sp. N1E240]MPQ46380.1 alkaline phosphatase [Marinifilum sp. N1E240]